MAGTRVLVVEDEALVLMVLESWLDDLGCEIVATAQHLEDALTKARELSFDVAILDANLGGDSVGPVADVLAGRGIPFLFASGYGAASLPAAHRGRPVLSKPYLSADLGRALLELVGSPRSASQ